MQWQSKVNCHTAFFKKNQAAYLKEVKRIHDVSEKVLDGSDPVSQKRHTDKQKLLVRQRIARLIDPYSQFLEFSLLASYERYEHWTPSAGIITGIGMVHGKPVVIIANDATVKGGSYFSLTVKKHLRAQQIALENHLPCVYLVDSAGAYLPLQEELFADRHHFGRIFFNQARMSRLGIAQISAVMGPCTAGGAYVPAMSDECVMVEKTGSLFLAGPPLVKAAINETVSVESLGGARLHSQVSGVVDYAAKNDQDALKQIRALLQHVVFPSFLPPEKKAQLPLYDPYEIAGIIPPLDQPVFFDVREIIIRLVDGSFFHEFKPLYGKGLVCGFSFIWGYQIGILANNGVLMSASALKGTHFIQLCTQRNIPLLFLQNITGFMVGQQAEKEGIAKHGAKLVMAVANTPVPKLTVIIGGSYGAGNYAMCGRAYDPRFLWTWPNARVAVMGAPQAASVLMQLKPDWSDEKKQKHTERLLEQYAKVSDVLYGSSQLWDDGIIMPWQTRDVIGQACAILYRKACVASQFGVFRM